MTRVLNATSINPGIFIGTARFLSSRAPVIHNTHITPETADSELKSLLRAINAASVQLAELLNELPEQGSEREIFEAHQIILHDPDMLAKLEALVVNEYFSAPQAVKTAFDEVAETFSAMQNDFFAQRAADYRDLQERLLMILLGQDADPLAAFRHEDVLFCPEPSPSLVTAIAAKGIKAWVSQKGAYTSHAAILSRGLDIVALTGIQDLNEQVADGQTVIVDALGAQLIVEPDPQTLDRYRELSARYLAARQKDLNSALQPAVTLSGKRVEVLANIELPSEAAQLRASGAEGIGLFRTEFLYLNRSSLPSEDEQYQIYHQVAQALAPYPVTIRSFDLGGDKISHLIPAEREENPYLGCRGIRFSLYRQDVFKTQLKAILRAAVSANIRLMLPMVNDLSDLLAARELIAQCQAELNARELSCAESIPVGVMIEIPSAALCAAELASHADFFSIGTNDLAQYTLAVDRNSDALSHKYIQHHPSVLKLIAMSVEAAHRQGIPVAVCGEMASIPDYIPLLTGMGIDELSVHPKSISACKAIIRRCDDRLDKAIRTAGLEELAAVEKLIFQDLKTYQPTE